MMLMEPTTADGTLWGSLAAGVAVILAAIYRVWGALRRDNKIDASEVETLRALDAAVAHWRGLYNVAWKQVGKERELREHAEARATLAFEEIEKLRGEVAALRREVEKLTAMRT